ncbi:MAG: hypothetical protein V4489_02695 [Chlamydiota bacterium]
MNITSIPGLGYFYPNKVEKAPAEAAEQAAPAEVQQAPIAAASQSSSLVMNGARALAIGALGVGGFSIALAAGNGQAWEKVATTVSEVIMGAAIIGVVAQTKDLVDLANPAFDAIVSATVNSIGYVSNATGATWAVSTAWNKTYASVLTPAYNFGAALNPYAKKV